MNIIIFILMSNKIKNYMYVVSNTTVMFEWKHAPYVTTTIMTFSSVFEHIDHLIQVILPFPFVISIGYLTSPYASIAHEFPDMSDRRLPSYCYIKVSGYLL